MGASRHTKDVGEVEPLYSPRPPEGGPYNQDMISANLLCSRLGSYGSANGLKGNKITGDAGELTSRGRRTARNLNSSRSPRRTGEPQELYGDRGNRYAPPPRVGEGDTRGANRDNYEKTMENEDRQAAIPALPFQDRAYRSEAAKLDRPLKVVMGSQPRRKSSERITFEAYTALHAADFEKVLALEQPEGWTLKTEDSGVRVYTMSKDGNPLLYFKGVSDFATERGPLEIVQVLLETEDRPKWDELCMLGDTPAFFPPFYKYAYVQLRSRGGIISARDMCTLGRLRFEEDGGVIIALASTEHPDFPERPGFVRINFVEGGYVIRPRPDDPKVVTVTWTGCVDPKGWLPHWLVNLVVAKQALTLAKIKEHIAETKTQAT